MNAPLRQLRARSLAETAEHACVRSPREARSGVERPYSTLLLCSRERCGRAHRRADLLVAGPHREVLLELGLGLVAEQDAAGLEQAGRLADLLRLRDQRDLR